jgi:hypothetical protein
MHRLVLILALMVAPAVAGTFPTTAAKADCKRLCPSSATVQRTCVPLAQVGKAGRARRCNRAAVRNCVQFGTARCAAVDVVAIKPPADACPPAGFLLVQEPPEGSMLVIFPGGGSVLMSRTRCLVGLDECSPPPTTTTTTLPAVVPPPTPGAGVGEPCERDADCQAPLDCRGKLHRKTCVLR